MKKAVRSMSSSSLITTTSWSSTLTFATAAFVFPSLHNRMFITKPTIYSRSTSSLNPNATLVDTVTMPHLNSVQLKALLSDDDAPSLTSSSAGSELDPDELLQLFPEELVERTPIVNQKSLRSTLKLPLKFEGPPASTHKRPRPTIVGHRGALYEELENTMEGFQRCIDMGCDAFELDVFLLKDGTLIVFHGGGSDQFPGDLTDYTCSHKKMGILNIETFEETQQVQFNPDFEEFGCPPEKIRLGRIPKLLDVLMVAKKSGIIVKIELKGPGVTEPVLKLVQEIDMVHQCHFSSFEHDRIALIRQLHPEKNPDGSYKYKTGALFNHLPDDFIEQAQRVGASEVHIRYDTCTRFVVDTIHSNGMGSMAWFRGPIGMRRDVATKYLDVGNEDSTMYETVMETGVEQLCVNRPDTLINMFPPTLGKVVG